jgi:hypothetical protein
VYMYVCTSSLVYRVCPTRWDPPRHSTSRMATKTSDRGSVSGIGEGRVLCGWVGGCLVMVVARGAEPTVEYNRSKVIMPHNAIGIQNGHDPTVDYCRSPLSLSLAHIRHTLLGRRPHVFDGCSDASVFQRRRGVLCKDTRTVALFVPVGIGRRVDLCGHFNHH